MAGENEGGVPLPAWTSRFTLSAQKPTLHVRIGHDDYGDENANAAAAARRMMPLASPKSAFGGGAGTPKSVGPARRVALTEAGASAGVAIGAAAAIGKTDSAAAAAATPLARLCDRFDALAVAGPGSAAAAAATTGNAQPQPPRPRAFAPTPLRVPVAAAPPPHSAPRSPLGPARRVLTHDGAPKAAGMVSGAARVSFGCTPVVVHRCEGGGGQTGAAAAAGETPVRSTAGRTPYSLTGGRARARTSGGGGGRVAGVSPVGAPAFAGLEEGEEEGEEDDGAAADVATEQQQQQWGGRFSSSSNNEPSPSGRGRAGSPGGFSFALGGAAAATPGLARGTPGRIGGGGGADRTTPVLFTGAPPSTAARVGAAAVAAGVLPFAGLPPATPKASLRKPERVQCEKPKLPVASHELRALLHDDTAAAAAAAAAALPGPSQPLASPAPPAAAAAAAAALGSVTRLSPARASRRAQGRLGADVSHVLTPVRRSARTAAAAAATQEGGGGVAAAAAPSATAAGVEAMLEATGFSYEGNPVLTPAPAPAAAAGGRGKGGGTTRGGKR